MVDPEVLRRIRLGQAEARDFQLIERIVLSLGQQLPSPPPPPATSSSDLLAVVQCEAMGRGLWASHCLRSAYEQILRSCPHLLGPVLGLGEQSAAPTPPPPPPPPMVPKDHQLGGLVELQYGQIASKLRQWKALEEERLGLLHDLSLLLRETASGSSSSSSSNVAVAVLQAMAEGFHLVQTVEEERILAAENNKFQDILMALETDLNVEVSLASAAMHGKLPIEVREKVAEEVDQVFTSILPPLVPDNSSAADTAGTPWVQDLLQYCMETSQLDDEMVSQTLQEQRASRLQQLQALLENVKLRSPFAALQAPPR
eukprot:scaffold1131_cov179-Ochromonas_danica.AAC.8